jgi:bacterial/archaeal transporter family-2 protein
MAAPAPTHGARVAATAAALGIGVAVAVQARINGELGHRINDAVVTAALSNLGGLLLLVVLAAVRPRVRQGLGRVRAAVRDHTLPRYQLLGGVWGAFLVVCQGLTVATIGVAVFTVAVVAGQTVSSLLLDRAGAGPGGAQPITARRVTGAGLAAAAVALAVSHRVGDSLNAWFALLPVLAGAGTAWQQAVNGLVAAAAQRGGPPRAGVLPAALVNFGVGTTALAVAAVVEINARGGWPLPMPTTPWLYVAGPLGVLAVSVSAAIVRITGVLLLAVGAVAGQLLAGLLLDLLLPAGPSPVTITTVTGTALTLISVVVIALPSRRPKA